MEKRKKEEDSALNVLKHTWRAAIDQFSLTLFFSNISFMTHKYKNDLINTNFFFGKHQNDTRRWNFFFLFFFSQTLFYDQNGIQI